MSNYIQVEIGGKVRGLKFSQLAYVEYLTLTQGVTNNIFHSYALIYAGLFANCLVKREEPDFTFEQVTEWCDAVTDQSVFNKISEVFRDSLPKTEDDIKKKEVKKTSRQKSTK